MKKITSLLLIALLILVGCTPSETDTATPQATLPPEATETAVTPEPTAEPQPLIETVPLEAITGIQWHWIALQNRVDGDDLTVNTPENFTITFTADGNAALQADCNRVAASYTAEDSDFTLQLGASTLAFCGEESLDAAYLTALSNVISWGMDNGRLTLTTADGEQLIFEEGAETVETAEISGTVTYLQRIALPTDAILHVQLQDISRMDTAAVTIAEQQYRTDGAQVPLPFTLTYDPNKIEANHTYGLSVRLTDGAGRLLFVNDMAVPVIQNGTISNNSEVILVAVGTETAETTPITPLPAELTAHSWQWIDFNDPAGGEINVENPANYQLQFTANGTFLFTADCNTGSGTYEAEQSSLTLTVGPMTRAYCGETSLDTQYLQYLSGVALYFMQDGDLYFDLIYDSGTMRFTPSTEELDEADDATTETDTSGTDAISDSGTTLAEDDIQMQLGALAESYTWVVEAGRPSSPGPGGVALPPHILLTFDGQTADDAIAENGARLYILPVETYTAVAGDLVADEIGRLQALISSGTSDFADPMPLLPTANTLVERWAQFSPLSFDNGDGVRYIADTPDRLAIGVWSNATTAYYYQGLTDDGRFYISLIWPISTSELPNSDDDASAEIKAQAEGGADSFASYAQTTRTQLDALNANAWTPTLTALDELVASLRVQN